jgi:malic enzyme
VGVPGHLANLRDRNEVLFYRLLTESHLRNAAGCLHPDRRRTIERFSHEFRRPHGVYLSVDHPEDVETALRNTGLEQGEENPIGLAEVVARTQPTILIGRSTHAGAFTEAIVRDMAGRAHRSADHHAAVQPGVQVRGASRRPDRVDRRSGVDRHRQRLPSGDLSGRTYQIAQSNNALVFPGLRLRVTVAKARRISEG